MMKNFSFLPNAKGGYVVWIVAVPTQGKQQVFTARKIKRLLKNTTDPATEKVARAWLTLSGKPKFVNAEDCQNAFGVLVDLKMKEVYGADYDFPVGDSE